MPAPSFSGPFTVTNCSRAARLVHCFILSHQQNVKVMAPSLLQKHHLDCVCLTQSAYLLVQSSPLWMCLYFWMTHVFVVVSLSCHFISVTPVDDCAPGPGWTTAHSHDFLARLCGRSQRWSCDYSVVAPIVILIFNNMTFDDKVYLWM